MKPGDQLHTFTILEVLGHGGMGGVFVGTATDTGEPVAIKTLFEEFSNDEAYVRRFQREASVYRKLNHPNIVRFIASGFDKGVYFIAMEHVRGKSLDAIIKANGALGGEHSLKIMDALAGAVYHAHSRGVIHRDIKPQNIMINEEGVVKLLDFGVAQAEDDLVKTASGSIVGTFFYSSPEQNQGHKIDERSDLYSMGLVFYEILTGQRALNGATLLEVSSMQMQGRIRPPSTVDPTISPEIDRLVMRLLERDPNQRFQSARDVQVEVRRCLETPGVEQGAAPVVSDASDRETDAKWSQAKESFAKRDLDRALALALDVSKIRGDQPEVHCFLGKIYAAKEYTYNAIEEFKKTLALAPGVCQYKLDFALALYSMKMIDRAREEFEKVLELDPVNPFARQYLQLIAETGDGGGDEAPRGAPPQSTPRGQPAAFGGVRPIPPPGRPSSGGGAGFIPPPGSLGTPAFIPPPGSVPSASVPEYPLPMAPPTPKAPPTPPTPPAFVPPPRPAMIPPPMAPVIPPPASSRTPSGPVIPPPQPQIPEHPVVPPPGPGRLPPGAPAPGTGFGAGPLGSYVPPPRRPVMGSGEPPPPSGTARDAVLGRTTGPMSFKLDAGLRLPADDDSVEEGGEGDEGRRFKSKVRRRDDADGDDLAPPLNPGRARLVASVWWGAGHVYVGQTSRALTWSVVQLLLIAAIAWPLSPYWTNRELDLSILTRLLRDFDTASWYQDYVVDTFETLASGRVNELLRLWSSAYLDKMLLGLAGFIYLWFEFSIPRQIHRVAVLSNLTGKVVEVRRDLSVKINLGEERGVQVGQVFSIQKRKHMDEVQALNFKTMIMAPKLFIVGEAKVVSTTAHFAVCKFRRLPGETSNPSVGDRVVLRKSVA